MKKTKSKFEKIVKILCAMLLAAIQIVGYSFSKQNNWNLVIKDGRISGKAIVIWAIGSILVYACISFIYLILDRMMDTRDIKEDGKITYKQLVLLALVILLCWLPYMILFYPGCANPDVQDQLGQFFHNETMCWTRKYVNLVDPQHSYWNNHHPVFHTLVLGIFAQFGKQIGHISVGIFLLTLIQMILMAGIFAYILLYLKKMNFNNVVLGVVFVFYAFWPLAPLTTMSLCKDTLFTICILIATIMLFHLLKEPEMFWKKKRNMVGLIVIFILQGLFRNNGLYLLLVAFPFILLLGKGFRKRIFISFLIPILFLGVFIPKVVFNITQIAPGSEKEMLSVPLQQTARLLKEHENDVTQKNKKIIETTMCPGSDYHILIERYDPRSSDPVKALYNIKQTSGQRKAYLKVWAKYLFRYPSVYIQAAINNSYEYLYYERYGEGTMYYNGITVDKELFLGVDNTSSSEKWRLKLRDTLFSIKENPYIGWILNIGFYMNLFIILIVYGLQRKKYATVGAFSLIILNIGINFIGPKVYMRYAFFFIVSIPVLIGFMKKEREKR